MKRTVIIVASLFLLIAASGCDSVRSFLGKPTSEDIARLRAELIQKQQEMADSLSRAIEQAKAAALPAEREVTLEARRYNVIAGAFSQHGNVINFKASLRKAGYTPFDIVFGSGVTAVCVMSSDDYSEARTFLNAFRSGFDMAQDAWIYTKR